MKIPAIAEKDNSLLLLKSLGDRVKQGETIAYQERLLGYITVEWRAFCDGEIVLIESNGTIGIRPDDSERFYPYPENLLYLEQRRRQVFKKYMRGEAIDEQR